MEMTTMMRFFFMVAVLSHDFLSGTFYVLVLCLKGQAAQAWLYTHQFHELFRLGGDDHASLLIYKVGLYSPLRV
jgi:hypothetical protein